MASIAAEFSTSQPAHRRRASRTLWVVVTLSVSLYTILLAWRIGAVAGSADSSGYLNQARLLSEGKVRAASRELPGLPVGAMSAFAYIPLGFGPDRAYQPAPNYPIGLPVLLLAASWLCGWNLGPPLVMGLHALAGVALMFALARQAGVSARLAALGALLLAASPVYLFMSLQIMSDMPALVWTTAAVLLAWRSRARAHVGWAFAAGAAFALAVLVRPNNALALASIAIALGREPRRWLALIAGGLPGALALAAYNHAAYGRVFASGYWAVGPLFGIAFAPATLVHYARWLPVALTPLIVLAPGLPWLGRTRPQWTALTAAWILAFGGFYLFYFGTHEAWWYLRFLLPAFPALILATLLVLETIIDKWPLQAARRHPVAALSAGAALVLIWFAPWHWTLHSLDIGRNERTYFDATHWAKNNLPKNAIILAMQTTGALYYYTDFAFVRWNCLEPKDVTAIERVAAREGRPLVAMLFPYEENGAFHERIPGRWTKIHSVRHISFWRLEDSAAPPP